MSHPKYDLPDHKSSCVTNNEPARENASCTCDPVIDMVVLKGDAKFAQFHTYNRVATSWQASFLIEVVKGLNGFWPVDEVDRDGKQMVKMPSVEEVMRRSTSIVDATLAEIDRRQWSMRTPSPEELREDSGQVGFTAKRNL